MPKNNIIEINGKSYDTRTGQPLTPAGPARHHSGAAKPAPAGRPIHDVIRHPAKPAAGRPRQGSKTLMRQAVKKPAPQPKPRLKAQGHAGVPAPRPTMDLVTTKPSGHRADPKRTVRAHRVPRSPQISHFAPLGEGVVPAYQPPQTTAVLPARAPKPSKSGRPQTTADLLDLALRQAPSQAAAPLPKPRRKKRAGTVAASALAVLLIAFVAYQQLPDARLELASAKAGFSVSLPGYRPAGYSLGQLHYSPGVAALDFHSNSDSRHYTLTQKTSDWDSQALRDNFVAKADSRYQSVETGGRTVYLYGNNNATWVNGGVWYVVQSGGSLSNRQLVDLAASI